jgi:hypothetical protein
MNALHGTPPVPGEACKLITCVMPDNGTDLELLKALRTEKNVICANSSHCYGSSILAEAKAKPGKLPEPILARLIQIVVSEQEADGVFDFVCENAVIDQIGGGIVFQCPAPFATPYALPEDVPDEVG